MRNYEKNGRKKLYQTVKFIFIFLTVVILPISANTYSQTTRISLNLKNVTLGEVFENIEHQSEFSFLYKDNEINVKENVSVHLKNKTITEVLDQVLANSEVTYLVKDRHIVISKQGEHDGKEVAQDVVTLKGNVMDATLKEPLIGVNVVVKGTATGTSTDVDGNYNLVIPSNQLKNAIIVFTYIGYLTQEVPLAGKTAIDISLKEDVSQLDEVVVVGYGVQKRASITGSVASIESKDLVTVKSTNVTNTLAGKLPGLRAIQRSGSPGDDGSSIDIRGFGSALTIVDGMQRDFSQIDPNDIESISILKDASAAVYGFKGANGVILITTKKGSVGKPKINYSGYYGVQNVTRYPDFMNAYEYTSSQNEAQLNIGGTPPYSKEAVEKYRLGNDPNYPDTDWWDSSTKKNAPQLYQNLSVSGGQENVKYYLSVGYDRQEAIWVSRDHIFERYNVRSNVNAKITKGLTVDFQLAGRLDNRDRQKIDRDNSRAIMVAHPNLPIYANNTAPYWQDTGDNPNPVQITYRDEIGYDDRERNSFEGSLGVNWELPWVKGLSAKALVAYDYWGTFTKAWYKEFYEYNYDVTTEAYQRTTRHSLSTLDEKYERGFKPNQQYSLNYMKSFGSHDVNALLLYEMRNTHKDWFSLYREFSVSAIDEAGAGDKTNMSNDGSGSDEASAGLIGRVNYSYAGKYLVEASFRYDGSSKFRKGERWGLFPGVSLGWRMSEENFIKDNFDFVNNFKIRGSYGVIGDDTDFNDPDVFRSGYNYPSGSYVLGTSGLSNGAVDKGVPNMVLSWYTVTTSNIGFDSNFLNGLISAEFDYFVRNRDGLPATRLLSMPTSSGLTLPQENLNSDRIRGFEIVLGHRNTIGGFTYDIKANFTSTRIFNEYLEQAAKSNMFTNWRDNKSYRYKSITWGYEALGQFQSYEDILNSPIQDGNGNKSLLPGDIKYKDWNNDGLIDDKDKFPIGHDKMPSMFYGLNLSASYKGVDLTVFLQGAAGHEIEMGDMFKQPFVQEGLGNAADFWMDRWHREDPYDPSSKWVAGSMPAVRPTSFSSNSAMSTYTLLKQDYLRLKSLEVGYTFPKVWTKKVGIENLRAYVNGFNLLTFTRGGLMKYIDPESDNGAMQYYPQMKSFNFGVNLSF